MKRLFALAALVVCLGCQPAASPSSGAFTQAQARGVVDVLADAWNVAASVCVAQDGGPSAPCATDLLALRSGLEIAASSVDAWGDAEQANFPCLVKDVQSGLIALEKEVTLPVSATDAIALASLFASSCVVSDGGTE